MGAGLYIHIPICRSKCPYCDFYSMRCDDETKSRYIDALKSRIKADSLKNCNTLFDTVYFGGGTPSVLGSDALCNLLETIKCCFNLTDNAEITVECNPYDTSKESFDFSKMKEAGFNRISMGMQSANEKERKALGRLSGADDVKRAVLRAQETGFCNISLDLMLAVPNQTIESIKESIKFCADLNIPHISAYLLKIEEGTNFYKMKNTLNLPNEDDTCDMYLSACEELEKYGYHQYEISNFSKQGFESRHNLKYWNCEEYLGIGPSAHSYWGGKRFFYEKDMQRFIKGEKPTFDGHGGNFDEYVMLRLRLTDGIIYSDIRERFGYDIPSGMIERAKFLAKNGLMVVDDKHMALTRNGFLVSNSIIAELELAEANI